MIKSKVTITEKGKAGYVAFLQRMKKVDGSYVTVGFHSDAAPYPGGASVIEVALANEFGTDKIPQRSFIRSVIYGEESKINALRERLLKQVIDGSLSVEKALETLGFQVQLMIQRKIKSNVPPPNALSTQKQKAKAGVIPKKLHGASVGENVQLTNSKTLWNTGHMHDSVTYKPVIK